MQYSSIKQKKCKGNCGRYPTLGMNGFCYKCAPDEIKVKFSDKKKNTQRKANERTRIRSLNQLEGNKDLVDSKSVELNKWFSDRAKELKGFCANCGGKTTKGNLKYERYSICHILEKSKVKSVATHPLNFIELCYFGNSCHTNMDNKTLEMQDMKCWKEIQFRFEKMYPSISKEEYQFIPDVLIQSL